MDSYPLITKNTVKKNRPLKQNQKACKKTELGSKWFDFRPKIYKVVQLASEALIDLTDNPRTHTFPMTDIPTDPATIIARIRENDVVGLGGGGFPTAQKIKTVVDAPVERKYLIVNAVECDPGLLHDEWLLMNRWDEVKLGISALCRCLSFHKVFIASRHSVNPDVSGIDASICFPRLDYFYPMGEEHILIQKLLGLEIKKKDAPAKHGMLVLNIQTVMAIGHVVTTGQGFSEKYLTAADLTTGYARIAKTPIGRSAYAVLCDSIGINDKASIYIGNGILEAKEISENDSITTLTGCVVYAKPIRFADSSSCIDCGVCQKKCPFSLPVGGLVKTLKYGQEIPTDVVETCVGCGGCTYFCKVGINLKPFINIQ